MILKIGRKETKIESFEEGQRIWCELRARAMRQGSTSRDLRDNVTIVDDSKKQLLAIINWNGTVTQQNVLPL